MIIKIHSNLFFRYFESSPSSVAASEPLQCNKDQNHSLKDVSNVIESQAKHFDKTPVEKLSDTNIASEIFKEDMDNIIIKTNGKENICNIRSKHENTFNWKPSLEDLFGFNSSKALSSSPAVKKEFVNPLKNEINSDKPIHCAEEVPEMELKNTTVRKNPFAKTKIVEHSLSLASQNSLSSSDILTPDSGYSEVSNCSVFDRLLILFQILLVKIWIYL